MDKQITFKLLRRLTCLTIMALAILPGYGIYVDVGKYTYEITRFWGSGVNGDTQAMIVGIAAGERVSGDIVIPDSVAFDGNVYPVVGVGEGDFSGIEEGKNPAFYMNNDITSVTFPANIRFIGSNEFLGCRNIQNYYVAEGNKDFMAEDGILYELGYSYDNQEVTYTLFRYPSARQISTLTIPARANSVGAGAFAANDNIKVIILSGKQSLNSRWQLGNHSIENVDCKSSTEYSQPEEGVLVYGNTFKGVCPGLQRASYTLPEGIRYISEGAFCESSIRQVTIPESVTNPLSQYEFMNSSIERLIFEGSIPDNVPQCCFLNAASLTFLPLQADEYGRLWISSSAFLGCKSLEQITLDENVKTIRIARYAFAGCLKLKEFPVTSKMKISELNSYAFKGCRSLTAFSLGCVEELEDVPGHQFEESGLTYVNWPSAFTKVPYGCFRNCRDLTKINLKMTTTDINSDAFAGSGLTAISMMGVEWYANTAFYNCQDLSRVYFPINERTANYRDIEFLSPTCEVIVNNPLIRNLDNQRKNDKSEVKLYMSMFNPQVKIGDAWSAVYVPGRTSEIYSALTGSEVREMFSYTSDKAHSRVRLGSLAAGIRITGVTIEGVAAELKDGWWTADSAPSDGIKMNVMVNYTAYGNPMTTTYEYQFEDVGAGLDNTAIADLEVIFDQNMINLSHSILWNIYDLQGALIMTGSSDTIDLSNLSRGTYILHSPSSPSATRKFSL